MSFPFFRKKGVLQNFDWSEQVDVYQFNESNLVHNG